MPFVGVYSNTTEQQTCQLIGTKWPVLLKLLLILYFTQNPFPLSNHFQDFGLRRLQNSLHRPDVGLELGRPDFHSQAALREGRLHLH